MKSMSYLKWFRDQVVKGLKWCFLLNLYRKKTLAKWHLEQDIKFLTKEYDNIFDKTEEELRNEMAAEKDLEKKEDLQRQINKYASVKGIFGGSSDELNLLNKYLNFIKECLKF